jgi:hypothetical protein
MTMVMTVVMTMRMRMRMRKKKKIDLPKIQFKNYERLLDIKVEISTCKILL